MYSVDKTYIHVIEQTKIKSSYNMSQWQGHRLLCADFLDCHHEGDLMKMTFFKMRQGQRGWRFQWCDIIIADNIACLINSVLSFIKQYSKKQSSTSSRHDDFYIYRMISEVQLNTHFLNTKKSIQLVSNHSRKYLHYIINSSTWVSYRCGL